MKKISTLFFILISVVGFGQSVQRQPLQNKIPLSVEARNFEISKRFPVHVPRHAAQTSTNSRSANISFYIDYGTLDSLYNQYGPNNGGGTWYRDDQYSFRLINTSLPLDSTDYNKYGFTWFPDIMDFVNNSEWPYNNYDPAQIQMTIDTIQVTLGHVSISGLNDTITVSVYDYDSFQEFVYDSGAAGGGTTLLGQTQIITDTSILGGNGEGTQAGTFELGTYPFAFATPIVVPQGHRFIVQLNYNGPAEDWFLLSSARRNDCASTCGASHPYNNATFGSPSYTIDSFNSLYGIRYVNTADTTENGVYPSTFFYTACNGGTTKVGECEELYTQDFDIYPNVNAVIPKFWVEGSYNPQNYFYPTNSLQSICPNGTVTLTANGGGSTATPFTYSWTVTNGVLSNSTGQQTTLTTGNTVNNDTVIVTLTDANMQAVSDTFIVVSGGIAIDIQNSPQPIDLGCGQKAIITTHVSGSILGKQYAWNTGASGIGASTITDSVAGTFTVTVTNSAGCSATASVVVDYTGTVNDVNFKQPTSDLWAGCDLTFINTSTSYNAPWEGTFNGDGLGDNNVPGNVQYIVYNYPDPGVYEATLTLDSAGCTFSTTQKVVVTAKPANAQCATAVQDLTFANNITLMPNPSNGYVHMNISGVQNNVSIKVYNILGEEVLSYQANELASGIYSKDLDLNAMPGGTYLVRIDSGDQSAVKKLVISR